MLFVNAETETWTKLLHPCWWPDPGHVRGDGGKGAGREDSSNTSCRGHLE